MPPPAVDAVLTQMDRLDRVITRRLQIEDAFIQAMVEEFQAIRNDLAECEQNLNAARNAARNPLSGSVPVNIDPVNIDLREIGQRLDTAINTLQTAAPLNANNLDNMIDTVVGTNTDGSSRRSRPRPFLQSDGTPPGGQYLYLNPAAAAALGAPVQRPAAPVQRPDPSAPRSSSNVSQLRSSHIPASGAAAATGAIPGQNWPTSYDSAPGSRSASSNASDSTVRPRADSEVSQLSDLSRRSSLDSNVSDESSINSLGLASMGGWRTRRRRSKRHSKKRKP